MKPPPIFALDFDGVLCDSAVETGITGWKVATQIWNDMPAAAPAQNLIDQFRSVRPVIETGYEAALAMRMLFEGDKPGDILSWFTQKKQRMLQQMDVDTTALKHLFGETRDIWIQNDLDEWVTMNPLFPGIATKLKSLMAHNDCYIVTTKQERFVEQILTANQIKFPEQKIFGLDRQLNKSEVLLELQTLHPQSLLYFIEDRLPTLLNILQNDKLQKIKLFLVDWGYNTEQDRLASGGKAIKLITLDDFMAL